MGRLLRRAAGVVVPPLLLAACLFGDTVPVQTAPLLGPVFQEIAAACRDRETQWMVAVCLAIYLGSLLGLEWRWFRRGRFWCVTNRDLWLIALVLLVTARYALDYESAAGSRQVVVLLGGMVLGRAARVWTAWPAAPEQRARRVAWLLGWMTLLLAAAAFWHANSGREFQYRGATRWCGPWENPNLYGLLMGVGVVLAVTAAGRGWRKRRWWLAFAGWGAATVVCGVGLVMSYSRGAWLGTALALGWLGYQWVRSQVIEFSSMAMANPCRNRREQARTPGREEPIQEPGWAELPLSPAAQQRRPTGFLAATPGHSPYVGAYSSERDSGYQLVKLSGAASAGVPESVGKLSDCWWRWLARERVAVLTVVVSLAALGFWAVSHSEWRPARRVASVSNAKDFSWRNRVAAWEGALAMLADQPLVGFGWNQPELVYDQFYRQPKVPEPMAIQLNHYFMLGMSAGLPALLCFLGYVGLSLGRMESSAVRPGCLLGANSATGQMQVAEAASGTRCATLACRAGAAVLLIGFWFDGGLFALHTATVFWVLLELASPSEVDVAVTPTYRGWDWRVLVFAGLLGAGALGWASGRDPFERWWFTLQPSGTPPFDCVAVMPKPAKPRPVVVYLHGSGGKLLTDGNDLRQLAELGLAVVAMDYCKTNEAMFAQQFAALLEDLQRRSWADPQRGGLAGL
jgi:O-antigen ligase